MRYDLYRSYICDVVVDTRDASTQERTLECTVSLNPQIAVQCEVMATVQEVANEQGRARLLQQRNLPMIRPSTSMALPVDTSSWKHAHRRVRIVISADGTLVLVKCTCCLPKYMLLFCRHLFAVFGKYCREIMAHSVVDAINPFWHKETMGASHQQRVQLCAERVRLNAASTQQQLSSAALSSSSSSSSDRVCLLDDATLEKLTLDR